MNPYEELGLDRAATPGEIRAAYRREAQRRHPDKGGGTEDFQRARAAYALLSDSRAREHYDRTGQVPPAATDLEAKARGMIMTILFKMLDEAPDIEQRQLINDIRVILGNIRNQATQHIAVIERTAKDATTKRRRAAERITRADAAPNLMAQMLEASAQQIEEKARADAAPHHSNIEVAQLAAKMLEGYECSVQMQTFVNTFFFTTT